MVWNHFFYQLPRRLSQCSPGTSLFYEEAWNFFRRSPKQVFCLNWENKRWKSSSKQLCFWWEDECWNFWWLIHSHFEVVGNYYVVEGWNDIGLSSALQGALQCSSNSTQMRKERGCCEIVFSSQTKSYVIWCAQIVLVDMLTKRRFFEGIVYS